jgi:CBS domain-containing protein
MWLYRIEDMFPRIPLHWMWWPAIGAVAIGVGGYIFPPALGVGYDVIGSLLKGDAGMHLIVGILLVKTTIWLFSLGSGNSGGILAPLLMMGGALGAAGSLVFHSEGAAFWALVTMSATLAGALGAPLTATIFAVELTHNVNMLLPLLVGTIVAHACTALLLRRSILTEKISRRGLHLSREYAVDPLEVMFVREAMRTNFVALPAAATPQTLAQSVSLERGKHGQWLYPVINDDKTLVGVITRGELQKLIASASEGGFRSTTLSQMAAARPAPVVAYPDEPLRAVVYRMASSGLTRFPVVDRRQPERGGRRHRGSEAGIPRLVGMVALPDLLKARVATLEAERKRERVIPFRLFPLRFMAEKEKSSIDR